MCSPRRLPLALLCASLLAVGLIHIKVLHRVWLHSINQPYGLTL